ncbi:MAG TPA: hypothetical protein VG325_01575 [Solirubrobacteraceae bacterium]|nr:hypothetical protein [Solirubrobacteraceae bacterium]
MSDTTSDGYVVGDTLATTSGGWFAPTARHPYPITGYSYQWQRCRGPHAGCSDIPGANAPSYTLTPTDVGAAIRADVTARNAAGPVAQASAPTLPIGGRIRNFGCAFGVTAAAPSAAGVPTAGSGRLTRVIPRASGQLIALSMYLTPSGAGGPPPVRGVIYADSNGSPGTLMAVTDSLAVRPAGTAGWYTLELPSSLALAGSSPYWIGLRTAPGPVPSPAAGFAVSSQLPICGVRAAPGAPTSTVVPAIADITTPGAWAAGDRLTASTGGWEPDALAYSYQWQHCDATGTDCTDVHGATANTYVLSAAELGGAVRAVVRATNASGSASASSVLSGAGPRTVSRTPSGPAAPRGGWSVAYADAFGAPLGTGPGQDNTLWSSRFTGDCTNNRGFNSNEMEVFNCSQATIEPSGLKLTCQYAPHIVSGANYNCGMVDTGGSSAPETAVPGYRFFRFMPGHGPEWAIQIIAKFPPNTGEADPGWWLADRKWTWELDMFEGFGAAAGSGGSWCHSTSGSGWVGTTDPTWIFDTSTRANIAGEQMLCRDAQPSPFDPSAGYHTYTTVVYPNARVAQYIDGHPQVWDYVPHGGSAYFHGGTVIGPPPTLPKTYGELIISYALRDTATGNPDPRFSSGARSLSVRSIAVYENATAGGADALNAGLIPPGTRLSP